VSAPTRVAEAETTDATTRSVTPSGVEDSFGLATGRLSRYWWTLLTAGIVWIVVGFVVLRFDSASMALVSVVVGAMALLAAVGELMRAAVTTGGWRVWHLVFAALLLVSAVVAWVDPGEAFVSLALVVGFVFVYAGIFDVIWSLFSIRSSPVWWLQLLSGVAQLVLGFFASSSVQAGAAVLITYVSLSALSRGIAEIAAAFTIRGHHLKHA